MKMAIVTAYILSLINLTFAILISFYFLFSAISTCNYFSISISVPISLSILTSPSNSPNTDSSVNIVISVFMPI